MTAIPPHRHLDAEALAKLAGLQLRVKAVVEGTLAGLHRSPHHGASIEFSEHKEYAPGDDLRHLDWKAFGKFDRYYIKRFEDETDLKAYFLLDCSGSMEYGTPLSKLEVGSILVASLSYLLSRQGDQPSLLAFSDKIHTYLPPRGNNAHMSAMLSALEGLSAGGGTDLPQAIRYLSEVMAHRTLAVVVSDMFDTQEDAMRLLRYLRTRRHHVVLFHLLHSDELQLPFSALTLFESMEGSRRVLVDPNGIRTLYLAEMNRFLDRTRKACLEAEIEYHQIDTSEALHQVLLRFLSNDRNRR